MSTDKLDKIAKFEDRMSVVGRDNPDLAKACRAVHNMLDTAKCVAESIFNDDVADNPEVVMSIMSAIADEVDEINAAREAAEDGYEDGDDGETA
jgi:hypothetical protein